MPAKPAMHLIAGVNGSGKPTHNHVLTLTKGRVSRRADAIPEWARAAYSEWIQD